MAREGFGPLVTVQRLMGLQKTNLGLYSMGLQVHLGLQEFLEAQI